ncbi:MAG: hypothetical protein IPP19_10465 [Verrucomicrobia bacterium]|nr:hypothetical protein [Verrucomicrobiota bacterium]
MKSLLRRAAFLTALLPLCLSAAPSTPVGTPIKFTFDSLLPVPTGAQSMVVELRGGNGGADANAGSGCSFTATFAVTEGQTVEISSSRNGSGAWKVVGDFGWAIAGQGGYQSGRTSGKGARSERRQCRSGKQRAKRQHGRSRPWRPRHNPFHGWQWLESRFFFSRYDWGVGW